MCENMHMLLENIKGYMDSDPNFEFVKSKFGIVFLENAAKRGVRVETEFIENFEQMIALLCSRVEDDILSKHGWRGMTQEDAEELRRRVLPFLSGLPNEKVAKEQMERYIAEQLE